MQKNLIIFEYTDEVETFITQRSFDALKSEHVNIIAIQPDVQAYLKRKNIFFFNTIKFFNKESHQNILLKSAEIIEPFRRLLNIEDCLGIKEGYNNAFIFYLRHYSILYLLWLVEIVNNAIDRLKPEKIIAVKRDYYPDAMDSVPINERCLGIIVEKLAEKRVLQVELLTGENKNYNSIVEKTKLSFLEIIKIIFFQINMVLFGYRSKGRKYVLYSSTSYNLTKVIQSLISKYDRLMYVLIYSNNKAKDLKRMLCDDKHWNILSCLPAYLPSDKRSGFIKKLNKTIISLKEFFSNNKQILSYKGIEFHELVFLKIKESMVPFLINLYGQTYYLDKFIRNKNPALVLSQMARGIFYNLGELASLYNIPSVLISHGSHVPASNRYADLEWGEHSLGLMKTHYKYLAIQSPWALGYLENKPSNSIPIITGPLLFTKIRNDENVKLSTKKRIIPQHYNKIVILHAGTPKPAQSLRPYVYETIDEYIKNINSLITAVDKLQETHLIVRFRRSDYLRLSDFLELLVRSDCYSVHSDGSFLDYLTMADLLVSYSSTAIEEALQNKVPVLLYDSHGKYCHIKDAQVLEPSLSPNVDSCYFVDSEKTLEWGLKWIERNHLRKDNMPEFLWERHNFSNGETVNLSTFFGNLFVEKIS